MNFSDIQSTLVVSNYAGREKTSRQAEFELKNRQSKSEVITGSQGMVKNTFQERGKGLR